MNTRQLLLAGFGALIAAATIVLTSHSAPQPESPPDTGGNFFSWYVWSLKEGEPFPPDTCTNPHTVADVLLAPCDTGGRL
jgi:hypothetical protein